MFNKICFTIRTREKSKSDGSSAYLYDAFLSFNEGDHDLVYDHLAPHLEDRHGTGSLNLFDDLTESRNLFNLDARFQ